MGDGSLSSGSSAAPAYRSWDDRIVSAIAYLLYYRLIADTGPTKALTVTFLMPVFGMIWGATILHESITMSMLAGTALILLGMTLVLNLRIIPFRPSSVS